MRQDTTYKCIIDIFPVTHAELAWQMELPSSVTICQNKMWLKNEMKYKQQKQKYGLSHA